MISLSQDNGTSAAIYNNILVLTDGTVLGIVLGHCVFGWNGHVKAKFFKQTFYMLDGRILAKEIPFYAPLNLDKVLLMEKSWELMNRIKDHSCPWITPQDKWSGIFLIDHFLPVEQAS